MKLTLSETDWQAQVVKLAQIHGWTVTHHLRSRGTLEGWPDLSLIRPPEFMVAELKTETGKLSHAQDVRLAQLEACGIEVHVWRPSDLPEILRRLPRRHG